MSDVKTYVAGHKSPDTDSICSAIGYAHLKRALGENVLPARAGKMNAETKYVLEKFSIEKLEEYWKSNWHHNAAQYLNP